MSSLDSDGCPYSPSQLAALATKKRGTAAENRCPLNYSTSGNEFQIHVHSVTFLSSDARV